MFNRLSTISVQVVFLTFLLTACENRDVNHADGPNFSEIHEDIQYHFDQVAIEGHQYFILERDRNNPHEGFGFMAMKANNIVNNQDSIKAYLKTLLDVQKELLSKQTGRSIEEVDESVNQLFSFHFKNSETLKIVKKEKNKNAEE